MNKNFGPTSCTRPRRNVLTVRTNRNKKSEKRSHDDHYRTFHGRCKMTTAVACVAYTGVMRGRGGGSIGASNNFGTRVYTPKPMQATNEYDVTLLKVIDGDTVDVDIDLGFGVCLKGARVRIVGIDAPESRTSDSVEKLFGLAAKTRVVELLKNGARLITTDDKHGTDARGKFGRILGDFRINGTGRLLTQILIEERHCVPYTGGSKTTVCGKHMENRQVLLNNGTVRREDYENAIPTS